MSKEIVQMGKEQAALGAEPLSEKNTVQNIQMQDLF